ncbi:bone morphogenetic protein receptor type-2 isoform X2 [Agrilus planipennis]|nr:bone morphogenetic protein receptor type-2 isoform X2 [Agrilus planipennis]
MHYTTGIYVLLHVALLPSITGASDENGDNSKESYVICARSIGSIQLVKDAEISALELNSTNLTITCRTNYCYAYWEEDMTGNVADLSQGCWKSSGRPADCERNECLSDKRPPKGKNNTKFCCCSGDLCNANFTSIAVPEEERILTSTPPIEDVPKLSLSPLIWVVSGVSFVFFMICSGTLAFFCWHMKPKKNDIEVGQPPMPTPEEFNLEKLKLCGIIGQGRYGCVYRGMIEDQEVAVKVFLPHHRNYFINEHEIYKLVGDNASLLKCFGGGERNQTPGAPSDYVLIFSLEQQCLQEYLKNHTLDLATLCKMSLGIAKGLAHLHSNYKKPCIAHRDINTRNVLVKHDQTCVICDLGLAVVPKKTENHSLSEAGTLRYMAPEVLEGAVNLRDCESALKQIDVYALGLVLWELGTRCTDMQAAEPQPYALPFYREVGENPSLEQMQTLISRHKARPLWPPSWKDTAAARLFCETTEDCWDQDAEARLTSLCVEERLLELPTLKGRVLHPMHPPASPTPLINNNHLHDNTMDSSVGTIETLLSPTEENCKNSNQLVPCVAPLQPFQGRNPCLERNLLLGSSDCLLVDKSSKHCNSSESQNLLTNDFLNFHLNHRATPIPYVQNAVHGSPKRYNCAVNVAPKASRFKWNGFKNLFNNRKKCNNYCSTSSECKETKVQMAPAKLVNGNFGQNEVTTMLLNENETKDCKRPSSLSLKKRNCEDEKNNCNNTAGVAQLLKKDKSLRLQRSLEQFSEVFSSSSDLSKLKDPSVRVKTPGDVPPSVRRTRGKAANDSARFSLYDDRIMTQGQWGSTPTLNPQQQETQRSNSNLQDRDSISSF